MRPNKWTILLTGDNHGLVGRHGKTWEGSPAEYERVDVVVDGDLLRITHERDVLAEAIRDAAVKAGVARADACLTGPHLMMLCNDMAECIIANTSADGVAGAGDVKTWQDRYESPVVLNTTSFMVAQIQARDAEIADLRAQLEDSPTWKIVQEHERTIRSFQSRVIELEERLARQQAPVGDSVDTPKFRNMLATWSEHNEDWRIRHAAESMDEIISYIDAWKDAQLARERQDYGARSSHVPVDLSFMHRCDIVHDHMQAYMDAAPDGEWVRLSEAQDRVDAANEKASEMPVDPAPQAQGEPVAYFRQSSSFGPWIECKPDEEGAVRFAAAPQADEVRDAVRYRWLRDKAGDMGEVVAPHAAMLTEEGKFDDLIDGAELDAAIDVAMRTTAADN